MLFKTCSKFQSGGIYLLVGRTELLACMHMRTYGYLHKVQYITRLHAEGSSSPIVSPVDRLLVCFACRYACMYVCTTQHIRTSKEIAKALGFRSRLVAPGAAPERWAS